MNEATLKTLNAKFPKKQIKRRKLGAGDNERVVDYVTGSIVIRRLNETFNGEWSFAVLDRVIDMTENQIAILGRLTVPRWRVDMLSDRAERKTARITSSVQEPQQNPNVNVAENVSDIVEDTRPIQSQYNIVKEQWGGATIERYRTSKTIIDLGNNLKAAATDALKKCASLLGIGLHLYDVDEVLSTTETDDEKSEAAKSAESTPAQQEELKPASKIQQQAVLKVLSARKVEPSTLLEYLKIAKMDDVDSATAGLIITMKHPFWKEIQHER